MQLFKKWMQISKRKKKLKSYTQAWFFSRNQFKAEKQTKSILGHVSRQLLHNSNRCCLKDEPLHYSLLIKGWGKCEGHWKQPRWGSIQPSIITSTKPPMKTTADKPRHRQGEKRDASSSASTSKVVHVSISHNGDNWVIPPLSASLFLSSSSLCDFRHSHLSVHTHSPFTQSSMEASF